MGRVTGAPPDAYELRPIGWVRSPLQDVALAPKQEHEGAPEAWIELDPAVAPAAAELAPGDRVLVLTWLHRADRAVLRVHPRGDPANPEAGVFSTRSPHRPNPVGVHVVHVTDVEGSRLRVDHLEAVDGTPVVDIKVADAGPGAGCRPAPAAGA